MFVQCLICTVYLRYWYHVQEEEASSTQSILLPVPSVPGCLDLHDNSIPGSIHPDVLAGQVT